MSLAERDTRRVLCCEPDTLFVGAFGRCDLPHSDADALFASLVRLMEFNDRAAVLPGHNCEPVGARLAAQRAGSTI